MDRDIAIIGMSCRFPGARNYTEYWNILRDGRNEVREIPRERWDLGDFAKGAPNIEGVDVCKWGGFIDDVASFDALFFNISPAEASYIDPQHRLFLEECWHCIEDAGYSVDKLAGKNIGVYAGVSKNDYAEAMREKRKEIASFVSTGTVHSILANRVSFLFDFKGKSEVVDTACSSFLVALNNAVHDIRSGQCDEALVGGVNLLLTPTMYIAHSMSGMLSKSGTCRTFDANADGYVRGEGVGVIYIKSLNEALRQKDNIIGVIKGIAVRHGGQGNFLTAPKASSQTETIRLALQDSGFESNSVTYIEAHGTGTPLGDPIEISGLSQVYAAGEVPCYLTSAKSNIGHLESAAGAAGLIKVLLSMKYGVIPKVVHFRSINPNIKLSSTRLKIAESNIEWPQIFGEQLAQYRAGLSSFGMGGVNAHVIVEGWNRRNTTKQSALKQTQPARTHAIPYSAANNEGIIELLRVHAAFYKSNRDDIGLENIAYTMQSGRANQASRFCMCASSLMELIDKIEQYTGGSLDLSDRSVPRCSELKLPAKLLEEITEWERGGNVLWDASRFTEDARRIPLPGYPFAKRTCWFDNSFTKKEKLESQNIHDRGIHLSTYYVSKGDAFYKHHVVQGEPIMPAAKFVALMLEHLQKWYAENLSLSEIFWIAPFKLRKQTEKLYVRSESENGRLSLVVCDDEREYVTATASETHVEKWALGEAITENDTFSKSDIVLEKSDVYVRFKRYGLDYGDYFRVIEKAIVNERVVIADINCEHGVNHVGQDNVAILDGVFQAVVLLHTKQSNYDERNQFVPFYLRSLVWGPTNKAKKYVVHVFKHGDDDASLQFSMILRSETGDFISGFTCFQKKKYGNLEDKSTGEQVRLSLFSTELRANPVAMQAEKVRSLTIISNASSIFYSNLEEKIGNVRYIEKSKTRGEDQFEVISDILRDGGDGHIIVIVDDQLTRSSISNDECDYQLVFRLIRHILKNRVTKAVQVYYAYSHSAGSPPKAHAILAGFARTLKLENPHVKLETVGFDSVDPINWQKNLYQEVQSYHYAPLCEVVWQGDARYDKVVRRCKQSDLPVVNAGMLTQGLLRHGGVYLIAGGAGGIGSVFAEYLAKNYSATIHVIGRSKSGPTQSKLVRNVENAGGKCCYRSCDVSQQQQVDALFKELNKEEVVLDGIILCAGLIEDSFIINKNTESFERVLAPKVDGVVNLDKASSGHRLDFFVLFSSIASYMPNHGQCDYAGANSFLDAYAQYRNSLVETSNRSGRTISINWPLWENGGIRVTAEEESYLREVFGMNPITKDAALSVFEHSLRTDVIDSLSHIIAVDGEKKKIDKCLSVTGHYGITVGEPYGGDTFIANWLTNELLEYLKDRSGQDVVIDNNAKLSVQGLDSLGVVSLAARIHAHFGVDIGPTMLFEANTITQLVDYIKHNSPQNVVRSGLTYSKWNALFELSNSDPVDGCFRKTLSCREYFMRDHIVEGEYNVPGACYIEMALEAFAYVKQWDPATKGIRISNNYWAKQLSTKGGELVAELKLISRDAKTEYTITSATNGTEETYAVGELELVELNPVFDTMQLGNEESSVRREREEIYTYIRAEGLHVGETLMPMESIVLSEKEAISQLALPASIRHTVSDYILHPTLFTGILQTALLNNRPNGIGEDKYIPIGVDEISIYDEISPRCVVHSTKRRLGNEDRIKKYDAKVYSNDGKLLVALEGITLRCKSHITSEEKPMCQPEDANLTKLNQLDEVMEYFSSLLAEATGMDREEIESDSAFEKYGIDSIMIIGINRKLEKHFGNISKTLLFEYRTIRELGSYFHCNHLAALIKGGIVSDAVSGKSVIGSFQKVPRKSHVDTGIGHVSGATGNNPSFSHESGSADTGSAQSNLLEAPYAFKESSDQYKSTNGSTVGKNDIAIVGVAGIYPGASDIYEFWENLKSAVSSITETPKERLDIDILDRTKFTDTNNCKWGGYLEDVEHFDPWFFNISPREASNLDPQERIFLQVAWNTVESAGYDASKLRGSYIGVYVGALWQPYTCLGVAETHKGNTQTPNGLLYNIPNRVSYFFDWCGPSIAIDTACSSSLTALHVACQGIICGEVQTALVGGVNLSYSSSKFLWLSSNHFLSSEGKCRSFGDGGDGYVPGEGAGAVFIKRLSEAVKDNDHIWGVIKSSSINHGGRTNGFTVPNPNKQRDLITSSLKKAEISARDISYVEAHGTGTSLGDPIEIAGLKQAFEIHTDDRQFCAIGSVKSNIGHLEAAAGIAGLTKTLLQLKHRLKVPSLYSEIENRNIEFCNSPFYVQKAITAWESNSANGSKTEPRAAMVSSFGAGGSNAHLIVTEYIGDNSTIGPDANDGNLRRTLFPFSARSRQSLIARIESFHHYLQSNHDESLRDVAYTLQEGRSQMDERAIFVASSAEELKKKIGEFLLENNSFSNNKSNSRSDCTRQQIIDKDDVNILVSHWSKQGQLKKIVNLWDSGCTFDWQALLGKGPFSKVPLPTYKFEKTECKMPRKKVFGEGIETSNDQVLKEARFHTTNVSNLYKIQYRIDSLRQDQELIHTTDKQEEFEYELAKELQDIANQAMDCDTELKTSQWVRDILVDNIGFVVDVFPLTADDGGFLSSVMLSITSKAGYEYKWTYVPKKKEYLDSECMDASLVDNENSKVGVLEHELSHLSEQYVQANIGNGMQCGTREHEDKPSFIQLTNVDDFKKKPSHLRHEELAINGSERTTEYQANPSNGSSIGVLKTCLEQCLNIDAREITHKTRLSDLNLKDGELNCLSRELAARFAVPISGENLSLHYTIDELLEYILGKATPVGKSRNSECVREASLSDVTEFIIGKLAEVLYTDVAQVDATMPFVDLGLDSILGVEWIDIINREYGLSMAATIVYDYPTIEALANYTRKLLVGKTIETAGVSRNASGRICE